MRIANLFIFVIAQVAINYILRQILPPYFMESLYGYLAFCLISSILLAFVAAIMATPPGYKKDFYRQPGFHKMMLIYFGIFLAFDVIFMFV